MSKLTPDIVSLQLALFAGLCLSFALVGQYGFNLHPCHLCVMQRWPFVVVIGLGVLGFAVKRFSVAAVALSGLALFVNAGIALFHSGVERKWWAGLEGCSAPDMTGSIEDLMARIEQAATARCDEIPWDLFGLSMANYNVLACAAMAVLTAIYLIKRRVG